MIFANRLILSGLHVLGLKCTLNGATSTTLSLFYMLDFIEET